MCAGVLFGLSVYEERPSAVAQAGLELHVLQSQLPQVWHYRCEPRFSSVGSILGELEPSGSRKQPGFYCRVGLVVKRTEFRLRYAEVTGSNGNAF